MRISLLTAIAKKYYFSFFLIIVIFCLGFFLRFNQLSNIPTGLYPDETAIGYNAYSILLTGKDEHGAKFPMYFRSFDDYKLPVYIYSTALSIKAFGLNAFAVRFTSALFGSLTIIALCLLMYELSKKKSLAILTGFFIAVNPWHTFFSRAGYEVNLATSFIVFGILFFVYAVNRKNNLLLYIISIVTLLLALYTYNVTRLVSPLIFIMLIALFYKQITVNSKKLLFFLLALFFAGMIPFFITYIHMQSQAGFASQQDALIFGKAAKAEILQTRSYFMFLPQIVQKIFFNYFILVIWKFLSNIVSFFSTSFFFIAGANHPHENIGGFGMFYYFDLPLMLFGAYLGIKKKLTFLYPFYIWFLIMLFVGSIIVSVPNDAFGTRVYSVVIPLIVFSAYGFYAFFEHVMRIKNTLIKAGVTIAVFTLVGYSIVFYFTSYFVRFPVEYAKQWGSEDQKTVEYITNIENKYNTVVFDDSTGFIYTSFLFYGKYPPQLHQQQATYKQNGLVIGLSKDGKYEFRKINWEQELHAGGTLFITNKNNTPHNKTPLATFNYPVRPVVFYYDRNIAQYTTFDNAYIIYESGNY